MGITAALVTIVVSVGLLLVVGMALIRLDRRARRKRAKPGELAVAAATIRLHELRRLDAAGGVRGSGVLLITGSLAVSPTSLSWRPSKRFALRGACSMTWEWAAVDHIEVAKLPRSMIRCDAFAVVGHDERDAIVYVSDPATVEGAISAIGIRVDRS